VEEITLIPFPKVGNWVVPFEVPILFPFIIEVPLLEFSTKIASPPFNTLAIVLPSTLVDIAPSIWIPCPAVEPIPVEAVVPFDCIPMLLFKTPFPEVVAPWI
jgi:hypothetical protein